MLATLIDKPFDDDDWLFEIKWDGVRAVATLQSGKSPEIHSRTGKDLLQQFPELESLGRDFSKLPVIVDGEIVAIDEHGRSSFQRLQQRLNRRFPDERLQKAVPVCYAIFDLLFAGDQDLRNQPLEKRKALLEKILKKRVAFVMLSKHIDGKGTKLYQFARSRMLEGIMGKRRDSPYVERRTRLWVKIKTHLEQEFVVGGWTEPRGSRQYFGALLLGYYSDGKLQYAGHVGTGFNRDLLEEVMKELEPLESDRNPFTVRIKANSPVHWVKPKLVAEIKFAEWTQEGILRVPVFVGLRHDKKPQDVIRERPAAMGRRK